MVLLLAVSVFVGKDVKRQKVLSLLLTAVLGCVMAAAGTVFVVCVLLLSEQVL